MRRIASRTHCKEWGSALNERFCLPARLSTSGADALVEALLARRGKPLVIDASGVEAIGALACEVLVAAGKQWAADGQPLTLDAPSARFRAVCATLGLTAEAPWAGSGRASPEREAAA